MFRIDCQAQNRLRHYLPSCWEAAFSNFFCRCRSKKFVAQTLRRTIRLANSFLFTIFHHVRTKNTVTRLSRNKMF